MVVRQGIRSLLQTEEDLAVVGEARTGREAVHLARELTPDVVIMDIAMPSLNGLEATRQILKERPVTKVLALSSYDDDEYLRQLTEAGVSGYLLKQTAAADVIQAIRESIRGNAFFSPPVSRWLLDHCRKAASQGPPAQPRPDSLTSRQAEVLQLVAEGKPNKQIASILGLSIKTVEQHRHQLMRKLDIHTTAGLTRYAVDRGIIKNGVMPEA
jgi:DNA-binding NarL/FixJ family response regulator